jgi:hypothetical protein
VGYGRGGRRVGHLLYMVWVRLDGLKEGGEGCVCWRGAGASRWWRRGEGARLHGP